MGDINLDRTMGIHVIDTFREEKRNKLSLDYDPKGFLRCHSKKNDAADVQTQVRTFCFLAYQGLGY